MKLKYKIFFSIFIFSLLMISNQVSASMTDGTIDSTYRYAWGENIGFVDFGSTAGNVHITDTALSGYAYGENIGWINLSTVTNTSAGILSGYAWGENIGWVDFSKVTIDANGIFNGSAYGENIGWITFGTTTNKVMTDWRPLSARPSNTSSGSSIHYGCNDPKAINYEYFSSSKPSLCKYANTSALSTHSTSSGQASSGQATSYTFTKTLKLKSRGDEVKELQKYLNENKYPSGSADGIFGPLTLKAVKDFQKDHNLKPDGIVGPNTRKIINQ